MLAGGFNHMFIFFITYPFMCLFVQIHKSFYAATQMREHVPMKINKYIFFLLISFRAIGGWRGVKRHAKRATFHRIMLLNWNPLKQNREYPSFINIAAFCHHHWCFKLFNVREVHSQSIGLTKWLRNEKKLSILSLMERDCRDEIH